MSMSSQRCVLIVILLHSDFPCALELELIFPALQGTLQGGEDS